VAPHIADGKGEFLVMGTSFADLPELGNWIAEHLRIEDAVLDGEIACIDREGRGLSSKIFPSENPPVCTSPLICST
jgi:hypothetical protein